VNKLKIEAHVNIFIVKSVVEIVDNKRSLTYSVLPVFAMCVSSSSSSGPTFLSLAFSKSKGESKHRTVTKIHRIVQENSL
jgi:hypothetical protein